MTMRLPSAFRIGTCVLLLVLLSTRTANAETWAERLGYPSDAKVVIFHANEMGFSYETNAAGQKLTEAGKLRSSSGIPTAPWFANYATWAASLPKGDHGLELTLTSPWPKYRWQPVASGALVDSLVDPQGFLWRVPMQVMVNAQLSDVEIELESQLRRAQEMGLRPTHLTTNRGVLFLRLDLAEAYLEFARRHWIPAVVVELTPDLIEQFRRDGVPLPQELIALLDDYPLPKLDDFQILPPADSYEEYKQGLLSTIADLKPGLSQILFTPAVESDAMPQIVDDAQRRVWDFQLLQDKEVAAALQESGVILTDWREVMQRFEGEFTPGPKE